MFLNRTIAVLAVTSLVSVLDSRSARADMRCVDDLPGQVANCIAQMRQLDQANASRLAEAQATALAATEQFTAIVDKFEELASGYERVRDVTKDLRFRFDNRIRMDLGAQMEPLIELGRQEFGSLAVAASTPYTLIQTAREFAARGLAHAADRAAFMSYWNADAVNALVLATAGATVRNVRAEQIVVGLENPELGRAMLGLASSDVAAPAAQRGDAKRVLRARN